MKYNLLVSHSSVTLNYFIFSELNLAHFLAYWSKLGILMDPVQL